MGELSYECGTLCTLSQFEKEVSFLAAMMANIVSIMVEEVDVVDGKFSFNRETRSPANGYVNLFATFAASTVN